MKHDDKEFIEENTFNDIALLVMYEKLNGKYEICNAVANDLLDVCFEFIRELDNKIPQHLEMRLNSANELVNNGYKFVGIKGKGLS